MRAKVTNNKEMNRLLGLFECKYWQWHFRCISDVVKLYSKCQVNCFSFIRLYEQWRFFHSVSAPTNRVESNDAYMVQCVGIDLFEDTFDVQTRL